MVTRCHRCLDYGHIDSDCQAMDRSAACFKCGEAGHKAANCKKSPCCFLCKAKFGEKENIQHVAGCQEDFVKDKKEIRPEEERHGRVASETKWDHSSAKSEATR
ncbi:uncharacterized protein LOC122503351 [Leptopilina heterotoma]|uniref:uncharacterized protein LOC122503351 n=1 Tax=Leptopilina heterotoma TaxID=63436 RepID=UPI001CA7DC44|nr:uncharacterized protein LOC122503351 [Leptopilina heterotoma]